MDSWICILFFGLDFSTIVICLFCSTCSSVGHGELFQAKSYAFLKCSVLPFSLLSSFPSEGCVPYAEYTVWPHTVLEVSPIRSEYSLRVSGGQGLHFTLKLPALSSGQGHKTNRHTSENTVGSGPDHCNTKNIAK